MNRTNALVLAVTVIACGHIAREGVAGIRRVTLLDNGDMALFKDAISSQRAEMHKERVARHRGGVKKPSTHHGLSHRSMAGLLKDAVSSQHTELDHQRAQMASAQRAARRAGLTTAKDLRPNMGDARLLQEALKDQHSDFDKDTRERDQLVAAAKATAPAKTQGKEGAEKLFRAALKDQRADDLKNQEFKELTRQVVALAKHHHSHQDKKHGLLTKKDERKLVTFLATDGSGRGTVSPSSATSSKALRELAASGFLSSDDPSSRRQLWHTALAKAQAAARKTVEASRRAWRHPRSPQGKQEHDAWSDNTASSSSHATTDDGLSERGRARKASQTSFLIAAAQKTLERSLKSIRGGHDSRLPVGDLGHADKVLIGMHM